MLNHFLHTHLSWCGKFDTKRRTHCAQRGNSYVQWWRHFSLWCSSISCHSSWWWCCFCCRRSSIPLPCCRMCCSANYVANIVSAVWCVVLRLERNSHTESFSICMLAGTVVIFKVKWKSVRNGHVLMNDEIFFFFFHKKNHHFHLPVYGMQSTATLHLWTFLLPGHHHFH